MTRPALDTGAAERQLAIRWGGFALGFSALLMLLKFGAFLITDSAAVLSDALESTVNIATSGFALFAVWLSAQPRDDDHPYGHGRVEYLVEAIEGIALIVAGLSIAVVTGTRYIQAPESIQELNMGLMLVSLIGVLALVGGTALIRSGGRLGSPTLVSDGKHIRADAITTFGTVVGLGLVLITGQLIWDFVASWMIGGWLVVHGVLVMRGAAANLMDQADPELLEELAELLEREREPGWTSPHRTRVHRLGPEIHVDIHLVLPRYWDLEKAHEAADKLERALRDRYGESSEMMIHLEPCAPLACASCSMPECPVRAEPFRAIERWDGARIAGISRYAHLPADSNDRDRRG